MYDVIVIGARCAGASTAMLLARSGARVLLLDRATFPSDTVSSHFLHPAGVGYLREWGLLDQLLATGCPPIREMTLHLADDVIVRGEPLPVEDVTFCLAPRRLVLDAQLVNAAAKAGAEVRTGCSFYAPVIDGGRVTGIAYSHAGRSHTEQAALVIGADGRNSSFARAMNAKVYRDLGVISCMFYGYWAGLPAMSAQVFAGDGCAVGAFPTHDGQYCVLVGWGRSRFAEVKQDIDRHFLAAVAELAPELDQRLREGERVGRIVGAGDVANLYRTSAGPGWALVGDAGYVKDPAGASGIGDAFAQAADLSANATAALGLGPEALDAAVARYAAERDESTAAAFETNAGFATWRIPPEVLDVLREAQHRPERVSAFLGVFAGRVDMDDFLAGV